MSYFYQTFLRLSWRWQSDVVVLWPTEKVGCHVFILFMCVGKMLPRVAAGHCPWTPCCGWLRHNLQAVPTAGKHRLPGRTPIEGPELWQAEIEIQNISYLLEVETMSLRWTPHDLASSDEHSASSKARPSQCHLGFNTLTNPSHLSLGFARVGRQWQMIEV